MSNVVYESDDGITVSTHAGPAPGDHRDGRRLYYQITVAALDGANVVLTARQMEAMLYALMGRGAPDPYVPEDHPSRRR